MIATGLLGIPLEGDMGSAGRQAIEVPFVGTAQRADVVTRALPAAAPVNGAGGIDGGGFAAPRASGRQQP
jgi:hypothetical protein